MTLEKSQWKPVTDAMRGSRPVALNSCHSSWFKGSWRRALCFSSYYKFAAKMIGRKKRVLDVGCGDGLGTWILAKECGFSQGIDREGEAITVASKNWKTDIIRFECVRLAELRSAAWDALVNLDAEKELSSRKKSLFFAAVKRNLSHDGIAILGISSASKLHGISAALKRLEGEMRRHFRHVFMFSACGEVIHVGNLRPADHLIAIGCRKK